MNDRVTLLRAQLKKAEKEASEELKIIQQRCLHLNKVGDGVQYGGSICQDCGKDFDR